MERRLRLYLGEVAAKVYFLGKFPTEDGALSEDLDINIKEVRKALNVLHENGLIELRISVDEDGWRTYTWIKSKNRVEELMSKKIEEEIERVEDELKIERGKVFYVCPFGERFVFEDAFSLNFNCPWCEKPLIWEDNEDKIKKLEDRLENLRRSLSAGEFRTGSKE